jgi:hypothetical protein
MVPMFRFVYNHGTMVVVHPSSIGFALDLATCCSSGWAAVLVRHVRLASDT